MSVYQKKSGKFCSKKSSRKYKNVSAAALQMWSECKTEVKQTVENVETTNKENDISDLSCGDEKEHQVCDNVIHDHSYSKPIELTDICDQNIDIQEEVVDTDSLPRNMIPIDRY